MTHTTGQAVSEVDGTYALNPIHGEEKQVSQEKLADAEVWQNLV
ncbi:hypothetical protein [Pseudomonas sp. OTU5201]